MAAFGENVDPTATIASILGTCPFSTGLLREILQNSDNAKATKQIFVLDHRTHPAEKLLHELLKDAQGPALLAYNNATFQEDDWTALQRIHTTKIGKHGVGFRSCYHITDTPQILSGDRFAVLDPHHAFTVGGGLSVKLKDIHDSASDHIAAFDFEFLDIPFLPQMPFDGTIIRLPLRQDGSDSKISEKTLDAAEIRTLLLDFVREELEIVMLFLDHISAIEIWEIDERGRRCLGAAEIDRQSTDSPVATSADSACEALSRCTVTLHRDPPHAPTATVAWSVFHVSFPQDVCAKMLSERLQRDVSQDLEQEKLRPIVALAIPLPLEHRNDGRLFAHLPLPLLTGFPCHIHSLFALTPSRQNLAGCFEHGIVKGNRDELLVAWNRLLFDTFIPKTWGVFLQTLAQSHGATSFRAWPPQAQAIPGGDPACWRDILLNLLRGVADEEMSVWPIISADTRTVATSVSLNATLVASADDTASLAALAKAGIAITQPPAYLFNIMSILGDKCNRLAPESARTAIQADAACVLTLNTQEKKIVLSYLLSSGDLRDIMDIPVVPLSDGSSTAIRALESCDGVKHTILRGDETTLFGAYDKKAILLSDLPSSVQELLLHAADTDLNVISVSPDRVVQYIEEALAYFGLSWSTSSTVQMPSPEMFEWLLGFWAWLASWPSRNALISRLRHFHLLPTSSGRLRSMKGNVFKADGLDADTGGLLKKLGIPLLAWSFPSAAVAFLEQQGVARSAYDVVSLFDYLQVAGHQVSGEGDVDRLRAHIASCLSRLPSALPIKCKSRLRTLPIYSILTPSSGALAAAASPGALPEGKSVRCIDSTARILVVDNGILLPIVDDITFVESPRSTNERILFAHVDHNDIGEVEVVQMFVERLSQQPKRFQQALLSCFVAHCRQIPQELLSSVKTKPFVAIGSRALRKAPMDVVDPDSEIASLFRVNDDWLPLASDLEDCSIIRSLQSLQLFATTINPEMLKGRLAHIVQTNDTQLAARLLALLEESEVDYTRWQLRDELDRDWLPTNRGLCSPRWCRDRRYDPALFDETLAILDAPCIRNSSLRLALGWDGDVPFDILRKQLQAEMKKGAGPATCSRLTIILSELGRRVHELENGEIEELRCITSSQPWIPVSPTLLSSSARAILDSRTVSPGFHYVPLTLLSDDGIKEFLRLMGCLEKPSNQALLEELRILGSRQLSLEQLRGALHLLNSLETSTLHEAQWQQMLLPDSDCSLRELSSIYYDDLGQCPSRTEVPDGRFKLHELIDEDLAMKFRAQFLSSLTLIKMDDDDGEDMPADPWSRISNVLRKHSIDQAFSEFLANAADAGARQYNILVDERPAPVTNLLSSAMAQFQSCPALIIHNDALFKESDFQAVHRVTSKQENSDVVGKFGIGVLLAFHFTEVVMVVSGQYAMFLDPGKNHLLSDGHQARASRKIPLTHMRRLYGDHLQALSGLFDFDPDVEFYNGTLFRLPLRTLSQARSSTLSKEHLSVQSVRSIVRSYQKVASESLLFIQVDAISACSRDTLGHSTQMWSTAVESRKRKPNTCDGFLAQVIEILSFESHRSLRQSWHVVSYQAEVDQIPNQYQCLVGTHRIQGLSVALAGLTAPVEARKGRRHRLYSKLPLPTLTSLPVHTDASFILTDDKRSIRFEESGRANLESQYNCWLLTEKVPLLYIYLLEIWPKTLPNADVWPGMSPVPEDPISLECVEAFYQNHLAISDRSICESLTGIRLKPSEAVFLGKETIGLRDMLLYLQRSEVVDSFVQIRSRVLCSSVRRVDGEYLRSVIDQNSLFVSGYDSKAITITDINLLIGIMSESSYELLVGLPVLPLADCTLGVVQRRPAPRIFASGRRSTSSPPDLLLDLFPRRRFLHNDVEVKVLLENDLNVCPFSGGEAVELIRDVLLPANVTFLSQEHQNWVTLFWTQYDHLNIPMDALDPFPLVPTTRAGQYISFRHCRSGAVFAKPPASGSPLPEDWLFPMLECLGTTFLSLEPGEVPQALLNQVTLSTFIYRDVLRFLASLEHLTLPQLFSTKFNPEDHARFAQYIRDHMDSVCTRRYISSKGGKKKTKTTVQYRETLCQLPVWEAKNGTEVTFLPASDPGLRMLPPSESSRLPNRFFPSTFFVRYHKNLEQVLDVAPVSSDCLASRLSIPAILETAEELSDFKYLLVWLLTRTSGPKAFLSQLKVPDSNGRMVHAGALYAHSIGLFNTVFQSHPDHFVHPILRDQEAELERIGLQRTLNLDSFVECARTVHSDYEATGQVNSGATEVYSIYSSSLRLCEGNRDWQRLDGLRFIPSADIRRNYRDVPFDVNDYASSRSQLAAQEEVLRVEYEAVAWSQRALFRDAPSEELLSAYPSLGVPSAYEVVEHLRVLALRVAIEHPFNGEILSDLTKTYEWLQSHASDADLNLSGYKAEKLFLNVDDPADDWRFSSASQLVLNGPDEGERQSLRDFLVPFRTLLFAAGAVEVKQAERPILTLLPASEVLMHLRSCLNRQRHHHQLTDVVLASSDGDKFHAHRSVLAAATQHFRTMFCGEWTESRQVSSNATEAVPIQIDVPSGIMEIVLTYIYMGTLEEDEDRDDLLELLDLANLWDLPDLFSRVENQLIATITLGSVRSLRIRAGLLQATILVQACDQFEMENAHALR